MESIVQNHKQYLSLRSDSSPIIRINESILKARSREATSVFTKLTDQMAKASARASCQRYESGKPRGVFDGATVVLKDLFDQKGQITTAASKTRIDALPATEDAEVVRLLERAGAAFIGRTNLSEFAFSGLGINPHFGTPSSALSSHTEYLPGGSSSGSAVAVGLKIAQVGIGTDTSGSIRIPAALNGLFGFRPTSSRYSKKGVFPLSKTLDSVGILTQCVDDIILTDDLLSTDRYLERHENVICDVTENFELNWDKDVIGGYQEKLRILEKSGYKISSLKLPIIKQVKEFFSNNGTLVAIEAKRLHNALLNSERASWIDPMVYTRLKEAPLLSDVDYAKYLDYRNAMLASFRNMIGNSILAYPTVPHIYNDKGKYLSDIEASKILNSEMLSGTMIGSFFDLPGIAIPLRDANGTINSSMLLSMAQGMDRTLLNASKNLSSLFS